MIDEHTTFNSSLQKSMGDFFMRKNPNMKINLKVYCFCVCKFVCYTNLKLCAGVNVGPMGQALKKDGL